MLLASSDFEELTVRTELSILLLPAFSLSLFGNVKYGQYPVIKLKHLTFYSLAIQKKVGF